jgi:predicted nucleotidyltransferase
MAEHRAPLLVVPLMRTGRIEANLAILNEQFRLPQLPELIERKVTGTEKGVLPAADLAFHEAEYQRLIELLEESARKSTLPEEPSARPALHELLVRLRLRGPTGGA